MTNDQSLPLQLPEPRLSCIDGQLRIADDPAAATTLLAALLVSHGPAAVLHLAPPTVWRYALTRMDATAASADDPASPPAAAPAIAWPAFDWRTFICAAHVRLVLTQATIAALRLMYPTRPAAVLHDGAFVVPDLTIIADSARAQWRDGVLYGPPALVIAIARPDDTLDRRQRRCEDAFRVGASEFWEVDPYQQLIVQLRQDGSPHLIGSSLATLESTICPGLALSPAALWRGLADPRLRWRAPEAIASLAPGASYRLLRHEPRPTTLVGPVTRDPIGGTPALLDPATIAAYPLPEQYRWSGERLLLGDWASTRVLLHWLLRAIGTTRAVALLPAQRWRDALATAPPARAALQRERQRWWKLAQESALLLRVQWGVQRVAVTGDLLQPTPFHYWPMVTLVVFAIIDLTAAEQLLTQHCAPVPVQLRIILSSEVPEGATFAEL